MSAIEVVVGFEADQARRQVRTQRQQLIPRYLGLDQDSLPFRHTSRFANSMPQRDRAQGVTHRKRDVQVDFCRRSIMRWIWEMIVATPFIRSGAIFS